MAFSNEEALALIKQYGTVDGEDVFHRDCELIELLLDGCGIEVPVENRFYVKVDYKSVAVKVVHERTAKLRSMLRDNELFAGSETLAYTADCDFGHTNAGWESVLTLGFYGLRKRITEYTRRNTEPQAQAFYSGLLRVYDAVLRFMERASRKAAQAGKTEMARSLVRLCTGSPSNLFEALQTSILYYTLQQYFDATVSRTMGRLDQLLYHYYVKEKKEDAQQMLVDYIREIDRFCVGANIPFAIGGSDEAGNDICNELSFALLRAYKKADTTCTKLHFLWTKDTPAELVKTAFRYIREGSNSIVFLSDQRVIQSLVRQGADYGDAVKYHVVGCYECGADEELTCSCNARVNIPKALELALNGGRDMLTGAQTGLTNDGNFDSFEALMAEFKRQLTHLCRCAMELTDLQEAYYAQIHSAPIFSATYRSALEKGKDLYGGYAAKYNNSSVNGLGLATAADSLAAIRKAVFEDKTLSLARFVEILKSDWENEEYLRLLIKNKYPKYGCADSQANGLAQEIVHTLASVISGRPNVKGGTYRLGLFSIDWRWSFGEKTAASADGRHAGETLSQNASATFGADRDGATAHLLSAACLDTASTPNGTIVDIDFHSSAVKGENGIEALVSSLAGYFALGGFAVHYNVLDTEVLEAAKRDPEKYPNLQVRLCGWNVLFSTLSEKEKDEFIARSKV